MAKDEQSVTRTYRRDDGALMIEVRPGQFISESAAGALGLLKHSGRNPTKPGSDSRRGGRQMNRPKRS